MDNVRSYRETIAVLAGSVAFLLFQWMVVGLIPAQVVMVVIFDSLFFAHPMTRKLAIAMLPFVIFEMSYDWMRLYPNYLVNPIDVRGIYETEKALFGIATEDGTLIPCEYFNLHNNSVADFFAGIFYLCWVPGPIALGFALFFQGKRQWCIRFTWAFLLVNIIGFIGYYIRPTAPPWYAINHGFIPDINAAGEVGGLGRFDQLVGIPVFDSLYAATSNIFAAMPSLHAAYMLVATIYAVRSGQKPWVIALCSIFTVGIWCTAVYTCHHYILDVLAGIATACLGVTLFEGGLMRIGSFRSFINKYSTYVS